MIFLKLILFSLVLCTASQECGRRVPGTGVVYGGTKTTQHQWPWLVRLFRVQSMMFFCSSTLISEKHVLSAAHCVQDMDVRTIDNPEHIFALMGFNDISNLTDPRWRRRNISKIIPHPDFAINQNTKRFDADIAVLELSEKIELTPSIRVICLPTEDRDITNVQGSVVGHGLNEHNQLENIATYIIMTAMDWKECIFEDAEYSQIISPRSFCGGGRNRKNESIACRGDSGGGFYVLNNGVFTIHGIVSAARTTGYDDICDPNLPTSFTNVAAFRDWIKEIIYPAITVTQNSMFNLLKINEMEKSIAIRIPDNVIANCTAGLSSNILNINLDNVKKLIQPIKPNETGFNTFKVFTSSILAFEYLKNINNLSSNETIIFNRTLRENYEKFKALQLPNGSFDIYNTKTTSDIFNAIKYKRHDRLPTTILALKLLNKYNNLQEVQSYEVIDKTMNYIKRRQRPDGSFKTSEKSQFQSILKHSNVTGVPLTALILIEVLENDYLKNNYEELLNKGLAFIERKTNDILKYGTNYDKALVLYLSILTMSDYEIIRENLMNDAIKESDQIYFNLNRFNEASEAIKTEISSLVVLSQLKLRNYNSAIEIAKFLISKNVSAGKFDSPLYTVNVFRALNELFKHFYSENFQYDDNKVMLLTHDNQEIDVYTYGETIFNLYHGAKNISMTATGYGVPMTKIMCQYVKSS